MRLLLSSNATIGTSQETTHGSESHRVVEYLAIEQQLISTPAGPRVPPFIPPHIQRLMQVKPLSEEAQHASS
jgi:hypothetical protein